MGNNIIGNLILNPISAFSKDKPKLTPVESEVWKLVKEQFLKNSKVSVYDLWLGLKRFNISPAFLVDEMDQYYYKETRARFTLGNAYCDFPKTFNDDGFETLVKNLGQEKAEILLAEFKEVNKK